MPAGPQPSGLQSKDRASSNERQAQAAYPSPARTPSRRVSQTVSFQITNNNIFQSGVTPTNRTPRRSIDGSDGPSTPAQSRSSRNAANIPPLTPVRLRDQGGSSSNSRSSFSGSGSADPSTNEEYALPDPLPRRSSRVSVSRTPVVKQEESSYLLATPPTTPQRLHTSISSDNIPDTIQEGWVFAQADGTSTRHSSSRINNVARSAETANRPLSSQRHPRVSGGTFGLGPPVTLEDLGFDVPIGSPQPRPSEQERPFFVLNGTVGRFANGEQLRPFQATDIHLLLARERGEKVCGTQTINNVGYVLAYDMGCGKTATSLALIVANPPPDDFQGARATLVVVPSKGIMDHWVAEAKKFAPHLTICFYDSFSAKLIQDADIVLCTYNQLQRQHDAATPDPSTGKKKAEKYWAIYRYDWYRVITDEAHQFRNPSTRTADAVWAVKKRHGLCLTGTPAQNSLLDLFPLLKFLEVTYEKLNDRIMFERKIYSKRQKWEMDPEAKRKLDVVKKSFFISRKKSDSIAGTTTPLVSLRPRTDILVDVTLNEWERAVYEHIKAFTHLSIFAKITYLREVCDHPLMVANIVEDELWRAEVDEGYAEKLVVFSTSTRGIFRQQYESSRILAMSNILEERQDGEKTIIFTHFTQFIPMITKALIRANICWTEYSGEMDAKARKQALQQIADDDECKVIIISIKAGGTGLNITACNNVILMDPWWNPYFEEQAISRVHRIGQEKPVNVFHLVVEDTIEEHIMETQEAKRVMIESGDSDVKFEPKAELDDATMRSWLL